MDVAAHLLILVGIGCLIMGFVLLSQPHEQAREIEVKSEGEKVEAKEIRDFIPPVTNKTDRIWLQETRELHEPVRPFPTF
jgi:hypothetical protein